MTSGATLLPIVHLVDDDAGFRESLGTLLQVCGLPVQAYADAEAYLSGADDGPGCLLLDVHMPALSGLQLQQRLLARGHRRPIIFLTGQGDIPMTVQALKAGAEDFLTKPVDRDVLLAAIQRAFERDALALGARRDEDELCSRFARLTPREAQVCELLAAGLLNKQIAYELDTAERTVKGHRCQVMHKLGIRSVAELSRLYDRWRGVVERGAVDRCARDVL